jgi:hypothetical protein
LSNGPLSPAALPAVPASRLLHISICTVALVKQVNQ